MAQRVRSLEAKRELQPQRLHAFRHVYISGDALSWAWCYLPTYTHVMSRGVRTQAKVLRVTGNEETRSFDQNPLIFHRKVGEVASPPISLCRARGKHPSLGT